MKTNKKTIQSAMDNRLAFLDDLPSCRAAVQRRIAQEEEPVMKKRISFGLAFAVVLTLLAAAALAAGLLLSPRADAVRTAERALEDRYGITAEMQSFFAREQEELPDGSVRVTYTGAGSLEYPLGTYTADVKDGKAEIRWSHDGEDTSGGYEAEAWGTEQLKAMVKESGDTGLKEAFLNRVQAITDAHISPAEDPEPTDEEVEQHYRQREEDKTAAMKARLKTEEEMAQTGREFIVSHYGLNEEQAGGLELYTDLGLPEEAGENGNSWYEMIGGKPCFKVEYLLYAPLTAEQAMNGEEREHREGDGYYVIYVNVETGEIEEYEYNTGMAGLG